ncbi:MAG TPA: hypothetical protein VIS48_14725 [Candidatus Kryptonia bacterium]
MKSLDCAIFYEWEYDRDFVSMLEEKLRSADLSHEVFTPADFEQVRAGLDPSQLSFKTVIDRASDVDERCEAVMAFVAAHGTRIINDPVRMRHAIDKASMHLEFITEGIYVPYTIIVSPFNAEEEIRLSLSELAKLGRPFIIKPANTTGGGIGVVTGAEDLHDVIETRKHHKDDKYLLQQRIEPVAIDGRRAWFRPFYVFGEVFICWWDDLTHIYIAASNAEIEKFGLREMEKVVRKIHNVCRLDFFSPEIAATSEGKFIVIDYVNDMCDMRLKSAHYDGVPDEIVNLVTDRLVSEIKSIAGRE